MKIQAVKKAMGVSGGMLLAVSLAAAQDAPVITLPEQNPVVSSGQDADAAKRYEEAVQNNLAQEKALEDQRKTDDKKKQEEIRDILGEPQPNDKALEGGSQGILAETEQALKPEEPKTSEDPDKAVEGLQKTMEGKAKEEKKESTYVLPPWTISEETAALVASLSDISGIQEGSNFPMWVPEKDEGKTGSAAEDAPKSGDGLAKFVKSGGIAGVSSMLVMLITLLPGGFALGLMGSLFTYWMVDKVTGGGKA